MIIQIVQERFLCKRQVRCRPEMAGPGISRKNTEKTTPAIWSLEQAGAFLRLDLVCKFSLP